MNNKREKQSLAPSKTLIVLLSLVLCALVYIFVEMRTQKGQTEVAVYTPRPTILFTPAPPTPEPTPEPFVLKHEMIERLYESGLYVVGTKTENYYRISASEDDATLALSLYTIGDYVHGFTLEIEGPQNTEPPKNASAIEKALASDYDDYLLYEDVMLRFLLPKLFNAYEPNGVFPPNVSLAWIELAIDARTSDKTLKDSGHGYSIICSCTKLNVLTIAVGEE